MDTFYRFPLPEDPTRSRKPDLAFASFDVWPEDRPLPYRGNPVDVVPELMVEVVGPSDKAEDVFDKVFEYLRAGARLVWVVYPRVRQLHAYHDRDQPPRVFGDGSETKHFVYVGDIARANRMAFESAATDVAVNCSGPEPITALELVRLVTERAGGGPSPEFVADEPGKVRLTAGGAFRVAHEEAERAIGWRPEVGMREGLRRLIAWRDGNEGRTAR